MNKAFLSYFKHFETFLGKMYLVLTPRKTVERVPSQQGAPSKQTDRLPLFQHDDIEGYAAYGVVCPHITGQLRCGFRAKFSPSLGGGKGGGGATSFLTNSTQHLFYTSNPLENLELSISRQHFLSKDILLLQNLSASKNSLEEPKNRYFQGQIHWVPL